MDDIWIGAGTLLVSIIVGYFQVREHRRTKYTLQTHHFTEVLKWHHETLSILKKLTHTKFNGVESGQALAELSALIDTGRFYFPNVDKGDDFGAEKPKAFCGYRHVVLEILVAAYRLHSRPKSRGHLALADDLNRHFTSAIFEAINPRARYQALKALDPQFYSNEKCLEDLHALHDEDLLNSIWKAA